MGSHEGSLIITPLNGGAWLVTWRDRAYRAKSGRADHVESLLRLVAHALREQGHEVPPLICLPLSAFPPRPLEPHEERHGRPVREADQFNAFVTVTSGKR